MKHLVYSLLAFLLFLTSCSGTKKVAEETTDENALLEFLKAEQQKTKLLIGKELIKADLTTIEGETIDTEKWSGSPTVFNFWFTECAPCISEMPMLNNLKNELEGSVDFVAVTYNTGSEVKDFLSTHKFDYEHLVESMSYCFELGIVAYPTTLIVDGNNVVRHVIDSGFINDCATDDSYDPCEDQIKELIQNLLE